MQTMTASVRSLSLLVELTWDRLFYFAAIAGALGLGAAIGSLVA